MTQQQTQAATVLSYTEVNSPMPHGSNRLCSSWSSILEENV
ncbi:hypothetical protein QFZ77_000378 [Paenibacillus sp. V4I3]|nr:MULTISPECIES: hypothetical protein [unclassified Paenibacillus]MDQ0871719.1 hypothetical protein [Paenibacillus sp. V4I3]MDQ0892396.1 hypothetical protein [Paenibacillus sp. V4I9]